MKLLFTSIFVLCLSLAAFTQTLDSIFFNLYTDSLKKGTYNYINVVGHFTDSSYLPLSSKEIKFTSTAGTFNGNSLYIDSSFHEEKDFKDLLLADPDVTQALSHAEIELAFDLHEQFRHVDHVFNRVFGSAPSTEGGASAAVPAKV